MEIYEFLLNATLGTNMQKFITADGVVLSGHLALVDTMKDLIVDALSALTVTIIGYYSIKNKDHNQDCKPVAEIEDEEVV